MGCSIARASHGTGRLGVPAVAVAGMGQGEQRPSPALNSIEPPWYGPYARWCGRGGAARLRPIPISVEDDGHTELHKRASSLFIGKRCSMAHCAVVRDALGWTRALKCYRPGPHWSGFLDRCLLWIVFSRVLRQRVNRGSPAEQLGCLNAGRGACHGLVTAILIPVQPFSP